MSAIVGTSGTVTFAAGVQTTSPATWSLVEASVRKWSATITRGSGDTTTFAPTLNARTRIGTRMKLEGTMEGVLDTTQTFLTTDWDAIQLATTYAATTNGFVLNASWNGVKRIQYTFAGWLIGLSVSCKRGEINTFSCNFASTGTVTSAAAVA